MPKRILIFSTAYLPFAGGAEVAIKEITDRTDDLEFDMITLRFDRELKKFERVGNINVYRIGFAADNPSMADLVKWPLKINKIIFPFLACAKACRLHRKNKYHGIWAMMAAFAGFAAMFFKTCHKNVPYLLTLQEGDPFEEIKKKVRFVAPLFKRIFTKADFIQVISNYLIGFAKEMGYAGTLAVVPNGVDINKFKAESEKFKVEELKNKLGFSENDKIIITASRLVKKNAVNDVIKSLEHLPANVKFLILGDGPDRKDLEKLVVEKNLSNRIIFFGAYKNDDLPQYLAIADIFVRPSLSEGQGISFIEAMAAGVPVIATPVGGIVDFLIDPATDSAQSTGLFCKVMNPESIADKVKLLLEHEDLKNNIIRNARDLVEARYDWNILAGEMRKIFVKLAN